MIISLIVNGKDISELVETITWCGDTKQVARTLNFTMAQKNTDKYLPKVNINEGDQVLFSQDGKSLFGGVVFDIDKSATSNVVTYLAFDLMFYINNSELSKVFDATPESIALQVCSELDVPFGGAAATGMEIYLPVLQKTGYEAIMMAYTAASRANGKKYIPLIKNVNQLCVIEKGSFCGVTLDGDYNLIDATYKSSLQKLVNKVLIVDKNDNVINTVQDGGSIAKHGTVQKICKQDEDKNMSEEAKSLFYDIEQSASVTAIADSRAVSGYSLTVTEPITGLVGLFYIESDTHTFTNGSAQMQLTLAFKNMMDEKDMDKSEKSTENEETERNGD